MKDALIMYWHGLGDLICLTPHLRRLHEQNVSVDLLVRPQVISSHLFDQCPYVSELIPLPFTEGGPSEGGKSGTAKTDACLRLYESRSAGYTRKAKIVKLHNKFKVRGGKIKRNTEALWRQEVLDENPDDDQRLEVFIPNKAEAKARKYIKEHYPNGYIFKHTTTEYHHIHTWNGAGAWISSNLPDLPVFEADDSPWKDINVAFVMAREATHRVLSSSVFVHACDAMGVPIDVVHHGAPAPHALPLNPDLIKVLHQ